MHCKEVVAFNSDAVVLLTLRHTRLHALILTSKRRLDQQRCGGNMYDKPTHDRQKRCWYRSKRAMPAARCAQRKQSLASKP
jgi:hypothetical protein